MFDRLEKKSQHPPLPLPLHVRVKTSEMAIRLWCKWIQYKTILKRFVYHVMWLETKATKKVRWYQLSQQENIKNDFRKFIFSEID